MRPRIEAMHVNEETTAMQLVAYLSKLEEEFQKGGRIVAIPEYALVQIKLDFFEVRDLLLAVKGREELPEIEGDLNGLVMRMTKDELRRFFRFVNYVGKILSHFEDVGGELPELPPESEP